MSAPVLAWHFVGEKLRDGAPVPPDGVTLVHTGPLKLCASGFHAAEHPFDALFYAPGETLCRVACGGTIIRARDKLVCTERTILSRIDATELLRRFARLCALDVIDHWDAPVVVRQYLETGDETIQDAASAAASAAARTADSAAARTAASAATAAAARTAAAAAAWAADSAAAWAADSAWASAADSAAASAAARTAQRNRFADMVEEELA